MGTQLEEIREKIRPILRRHGVRKAGLFGSFVRGAMSKDSDLDIVVEIDDDLSLLDFIGVKLELEDALQRKVDLVEYCTLKPALEEKSMTEQVEVL